MKQYKNKRNSSFEDYQEGGDTASQNGVPGDAIQFKPIEVKVYGNSFDRAFKAFRSLVQKERILSDYKEKQYYEKPTDKKRRKRKEAYQKSLEQD